MSIPYAAIGSVPRRVAEIERHRTVIVLTAYLQGLLDYQVDLNDAEVRASIATRCAEVRRAHGLRPANREGV